MKTKNQRLQAFARHVLAILAANKDWNSDTLELISGAADRRKLADTGPDGHFRNLVPAMDRDKSKRGPRS